MARNIDYRRHKYVRVGGYTYSNLSIHKTCNWNSPPFDDMAPPPQFLPSWVFLSNCLIVAPSEDSFMLSEEIDNHYIGYDLM